MRPRRQLGVDAALKVTTEIGCFSIYSGAGKGKSAAALGVVLRSFGLGVASNQKHRVIHFFPHLTAIRLYSSPNNDQDDNY